MLCIFNYFDWFAIFAFSAFLSKFGAFFTFFVDELYFLLLVKNFEVFLISWRTFIFSHLIDYDKVSLILFLFSFSFWNACLMCFQWSLQDLTPNYLIGWQIYCNQGTEGFISNHQIYIGVKISAGFHRLSPQYVTSDAFTFLQKHYTLSIASTLHSWKSKDLSKQYLKLSSLQQSFVYPSMKNQELCSFCGLHGP